MEADHPVTRRIAAQAQGDLLVLERVVNEQTGKLYTVIRVDDVRRSVSFSARRPARAAGVLLLSTRSTICNAKAPMHC